MKMLGLVATVPLVFGLVACDKAMESVQKQGNAAVENATRDAASAVAAEAREALDKVKQQADEALAGVDASGVAAEVKRHGDALKDSARRLAGNDWKPLDDYVGQYPRDIGLFSEVSPITPELKKLLGAKLETFRANMGTQGPLSREQVLYVTGNKPHQGGDEMAYLLIDTAQRRLEVGLVEHGRLTVYASPGEALARPKDVQTMLSNLNSV
ncbi:hypothetical protein [Chitiniphilus eburneus]|uniref:Lipoprotein n=1 Tax=Chitiniphilus eburneus TaxID=2571148 RepID=A0A4U0PLH9_9NEIS|nr:hypothetical protein [Chitiniphilus eburneus]TJZ69001.1 hypothetical protein FAZ21_15130 [Chitiniphilus eburneus]